MKRQWMAALLAVGILAAAAEAAEKPTVDDTLKRYADLTQAVDTIRFELDIAATMKVGGPAPKKISMTAKFCMDKAKGLYRLHAVLVAADDKPPETEAYLVQSPAGLVRWMIRDGKPVSCRRDEGRKTIPGTFPKGADLGPLMPLVDAAFGYKHLRAETILKNDKSPLPGKDAPALDWYKATADPAAKDGKFLKTFALGDAEPEAWIGFLPASGWPVKYVVKVKDESSFTVKVNKLDVNVDLADAFKVPADVQAKLKKKGAAADKTPE